MTTTRLPGSRTPLFGLILRWRSGGSLHPPRAIFRQPSRRSNAHRLNVHVLLEKNGTREAEGQALIARGCSWAEKLLRRHEARVGRVAKRLLRPPHKMNPARFKQLMREGRALRLSR
jgi:hypothetical protein